MRYEIRGQVVDSFTGDGIGGVRVEAWDKDFGLDDYLGWATTRSNGAFSISLERCQPAMAHLPPIFASRASLRCQASRCAGRVENDSGYLPCSVWNAETMRSAESGALLSVWSISWPDIR